MSAVPTPAITIRRLAPGDIPRAGDILYRAFNGVFARHGYQPPILSSPAGETLVQAYHDYEPGSCLVALRNGRLVGSAFYHRRGSRAGIGPVTVDPDVQGQGIGRQLMEGVLAELTDCTSIRLFQDAFNHASFALYAGLGFEIRDVMAVLRGEPGGLLPVLEGGEGVIREMTSSDLDQVSRCDLGLTGIVRPRDLEYLRERGPAFVVEGSGGITGYAVSFGIGGNLFLGPVAAGNLNDLHRLVNEAIKSAGAHVVTVRTPARPGALLAGFLEAGFRIRTVGTYMVRGGWEEGKGANLAALFPEML